MNMHPLPFQRRFHQLPNLELFLLLALFSSTAWSGLNLPLQGIEHWAETFGHNIYDISAKATALSDLRTDYLLMDVKIKPIDGIRLVQDMKIKLENMLGKKVRAVERLVKVAQRAYSGHIFDQDIKITYTYPNSKKLNVSEFDLIENDHFNNIPVNLSMSTVHVPTNVYDHSTAILNGVAWSEELDDAFIANYKDDPTLTWQYFCSANGFLRNYPGTLWKTDSYQNDSSIDTYDCRVRDWYLQAAAYPKDVVILLDVSGSMRGLRIQIAKATVEKILDTLNDDDYFNVIKYSENVEYLDSCFNGTMVQATDSNKIRAKKALEPSKTGEIAHLDLALIEAFELLLRVNESGRGAQCNKAIMVVTDGAVETYEDIFARYNWPRMDVRIFTYLIGREVGDSRNCRWMACRNKGRFSHITSLADVHEHVQNYVHVMSRPMIISRAKHSSWTNVYSDTHAPDSVKTMARSLVLSRQQRYIMDRPYKTVLSGYKEKGLQMMTTVSQPVFDVREETINSGVLLGVMGTDVPLKELIKLVSNYKIGVNAYSFAVTSNGYALFHPRLKPVQPNLSDSDGAFNAVDISDLESTDDNTQIQLRNRMIDRQTGSMKMKSQYAFDQAKRGAIRDSVYYFTDIKDTPFSFGISLPDNYGLHSIDGTRSLQSADLSALRNGELTLAPWNYCRLIANESSQGMLNFLMRLLGQSKDDPSLYKNQCDVELIHGLLFDAEATRGVIASWMKENHDGTMNDSASKRHGIEIVFVGTKAGLTRYLNFTADLTDPDFIENHRATIEELYYKRAADSGEAIFTYSVPFNREKKNMSDTVVTASSPIMINEDGREAVAAVVGLQMKYSHFYKRFMNVTRTCPYRDMNCNHTCDSKDISCFLVDNNGYVVLSENPSEVGQFFGEIEGMGSLMKELTMEEAEDYSPRHQSSGVFRKLQLIDYQATCPILSVVGSSASFSYNNPLHHVFSVLTWLYHVYQEIILFWVHFNFFDFWQATVKTVGAFDTIFVYNYTSSNNLEMDFITSTQGMDISPDYGQFYDLLDRPEARNSMTECTKIMTIGPPSSTKRKKAKECFENVRLKYMPRVIDHKPCTKLYTYYVAEPMQALVSGTVQRCNEECGNAYSVNNVPGTNLMLIAVDVHCKCKNDPQVSAEPVEIQYNETYLCQKLQTDVYRKRPEQCHSYHPSENYTDCGLCSLLRPSILLMLTLLPVTKLFCPH